MQKFLIKNIYKIVDEDQHRANTVSDAPYRESWIK